VQFECEESEGRKCGGRSSWLSGTAIPATISPVRKWRVVLEETEDRP